MDSIFALVTDSPSKFGEAFADLRRKHAAYHDDIVGSWVILDRDTILKGLRDTETFSNRAYRTGLLDSGPVALDGAEHTRLRRIFGAFFTPKALKHYEDRIVVPAAEQVVSALAGKTTVDLLHEFAIALPTVATSALFGLPAELVDQNTASIKAMLCAIVRPNDPAILARGLEAREELGKLVRAIIERELERPSENLLGEVVRAMKAEGSATVDACHDAVLSLILGGFDTTAWSLASVLSALLLHPGSMARVCKDTSLLPQAIEEALRWGTPAIGPLRSLEKDLEIEGVKIPSGSTVFLAIPAAHYDDRVYPAPHVFDIDRKAAHLTFGGGAHFCIGAPLARLEARVGLKLLFERFPSIRLAEDERLQFSCGALGSAMYGPRSLRVDLDASS